jgi:hypothetical protein
VKYYLYILSFIISTTVFSQVGEYKYDKKTHTAFEGDTPLFYLESTGSQKMDISVKNPSGKELFYMRFSDFNLDSEISSGNPKGRVTYKECIFPNIDNTAEIEGAYPLKHYAKMIYENKLVVNGELESNAVIRFIKIKGNDYTKKRDAGNKKVIIIENNNQSPKNGVNINIGR